MPLQATSGAASYDAFGGGVAAVPNYIEDVFSTWLYTGNGSTQTINNGIDLAGKGGLVWLKSRGIVQDHGLADTVRGATKILRTNTTGAESTLAASVTSFNADGFSIGSTFNSNTAPATYASWTFREQPKFFDVVTYTGNLTARTIAHNLGSVPGCIIVKRTNADLTNWAVYHRSVGNDKYLILNNTNPQNGWDYWNNTNPTSTVFSIGANSDVNANGGTYVAYLFAHDAGGFGLTGTDNVISCGSFTTDGSGNADFMNLGYEPQWMLFKRSSGVENWNIVDTMRGMPVPNGNTAALFPNLSSAEDSAAYRTQISATGNQFSVGTLTPSSTYIYIAIRRGPMKVPTTGTSVFAPVTYTGTNVDNRLVDTGIVTDMTMARNARIANAGGFYVADRLRGNNSLATTSAGIENGDADSFMTPTVGFGNSFSAMNGFGVGNDPTRYLNNTTEQLAYAFRRAPSFFDEICYTGDDGSARVVSHNLAALPKMAIMKSRTGATTNWSVLYDFSLSGGGANGRMLINSDGTNSGAGVITGSTATTLTLNAGYNAVGSTYVGWLFGDCPGVSKVGFYTGNGTTQTIACGFSGGARFVLIKNTSDVGGWFVYDTARGMTTLTDPYLLTNSTAAQVATLGSVTTVATGFAVNSVVLPEINTSANVYLFLAIA